MAIAIEVATKDCTALTDSELAEMADLAAGARGRWEIGFLSKQRDEWVLVTHAREEGRLRGFALSTLERIGGTPSLLVGLGSFTHGRTAAAALDAVMHDLYRRAVLAFPDEDVLVGTRFLDPAGFQAFRGLEDVVPRPGHRATGEERAWGRRLAKRFGAEGRIDDRTFIVTGDASPPAAFDFEALKPEKIDPDVAAFFDGIDRGRCDYLIAFGWAMAEELASKLGAGK